MANRARQCNESCCRSADPGVGHSGHGQGHPLDPGYARKKGLTFSLYNVAARSFRVLLTPLTYTLGLMGCTTFRPNPVTGSVLAAAAGKGARPQCCDIDHEAD